MKIKQWLITIFSFAITADILLAVDLYTNLLLVATVSLSVSIAVACIVTRVDKLILGRLKRWYSSRMYGATKTSEQ